MRYREFILEDYKTAKAAFVAQGADTTDVDQIIATYRELHKKNQFQGDEKNIDWWAKQGWPAFVQRVQQQAAVPTKTAVKRSKLPGTYIELASSNPEWDIYVPLDKEASCNIGKNTDWCTTKSNQNYFETYFYKNQITLVYIVGSRTKYAIAMHDKLDKMEFFNKNDTSITQQKFETDTGLSVNDIRAQVAQNASAIAKAREDAMLKDPASALAHALKNGPFPAGEPAIAKNPQTAFEYALKVLKDRFPMGEITILRAVKDMGPITQPGQTMQGISIAIGYAKNILKDRWPEFEKIVETIQPQDVEDSKNKAVIGHDLLYYARELVKGPWPAAEHILINDDMLALNYAVKILKGPWPEYESRALRSARTAWEYIKNVIKGPWPAAESILKTSHIYTSQYEQLTGKKL